MLVAQKAPLRRVRDLEATLESPDLFKETEKAIARRAAASRRRGASSSAYRPPSSCRSTTASSASASCSWNFADVPESAARATTSSPSARRPKVLDVPADTPQREIKRGGIVGPVPWAAASP